MTKAYIEQIETGHREIGLPLGLNLSETPDYLDISNGKSNLWWFSLFSGYRQLARFPINRPHEFNEGEWIDVDIANGEVIAVRKIDGAVA